MRYFSSVLTLLFILSSVTVALSLNTTQIQIMKQLHASVNTESYNSSAWNNRSSDPCRWDGVRCSKNGDDVVELHLSSGFNFSDNIWQTVCMLPALQFLNLSNNYYLKTPTSEDIKSCTSLVALNLSYTRMSGSLPSLNPMQNLQSLDMSHNNMEGDFGAQIQNLTDLRILNLSGNSFNGSINVRSLKLEELDLSYNNLGEFPQGLTQCTNLTFLDLSGNNLRGPIPESIGSLANLKTLLISSNDLSSGIPKTLGNLTKLVRLEMYYNRLSGDIPVELSNITGLESLHLSGNNLVDAFPQRLTECTKLTFLDLSSNILSGPIPHNIGSLVNLESLLLSSNGFSGHIPQAMGALTKLTRFEITMNKLSGTIPVELSYMTDLESLDLSYNQLTGSVPPQVFSLSNLMFLDLTSNSLSGSIPQNFSRSLFQLRMGNNRLSGIIPHTVANAPNLTYLEMNNNLLQGQIPEQLARCTKLRLLDLGQNDLRGPLTYVLPKLSNLEYVDLSFNFLSGSISSKVFGLQKLQVLRLQNNHLKGTIPHNIQDGKALLELQLGSNNLTGKIPPGICNLYSLQTALNLSSNFLEGGIPNSLSCLVTLQILDLSNNRLTGKIPKTLASMWSIKLLDLSNNELTGKIPPEICTLYSLQTALNLSSNFLEGGIPTSLSSLVTLEILDLSNNRLTGKIPITLASMQSLKLLDLSKNELTGKIPEAISNMKILFLNLSNNHLAEITTKAKRRSTSLIKVLGAIGLVAVFVVCCLLLGFVWIRKLQRQGFDLSQAIRKILQKVEHPRISYEELVTATNRFNRSNLIAASSFGSVYKGILTDGTPVAVKVLNLMNEDSDKSFKAECKVLQKVRHRNLARIITTCSNLHFKALIFEFFPSGSLEKRLYPDRHHIACELGLKEVLSIAIDIAHAVEYLHYDCYVQIVHCDIKPSNVLLDEDMTAHLSDFGIARLMGRSSVDSLTSTMDLKGSVGYIAPEYGLSGMVSPRGDVYSYGILLLEMLTRKRPTDNMFEGGLNLHKWVNSLFPSKAVEVVEKSLLGEVFDKETEECLTSLIRIGLLCSRDSVEARPTMREVSSMLKNIEEDWSQGTSSSIKLKPSISNLVCDRGTAIDCVEASDTQSSTF